MSQVRLLQLLAIRAQVDALINAEGGDAGAAPDPERCPSCGAGGDRQKDTSTFGRPRRQCQACGTERDV